jgi:hypothetical protein
MQKRVKDYQWFQNLGATFRCIIVLIIVISIPLISIGSIFIKKGIQVYFVSGLVIVWQFYYSCKNKKYTFSRVLFYDVLVTFLLCVYGLLLPSLNFLPLTFKDIVIFWNFYIGLLIFGLIASKVGIKMEMTEEVYLD